MVELENLLAGSPPFSVALETGRVISELDIIPHWYSGDNFCNFYIFRSGKEIGTLICTGIEEWEWLTGTGLPWLAQLIGDAIDGHYI